jgi:hypothetical protein
MNHPPYPDSAVAQGDPSPPGPIVACAPVFRGLSSRRFLPKNVLVVPTLDQTIDRAIGGMMEKLTSLHSLSEE